MFFCDYCEFRVASNKIMGIHNSTFHSKDAKCSCEICGHQSSLKKGLARHKKIVHNGGKFPCRQCNYQVTAKENLAQHKRAVHDGVKYPCGQCNHQATSKGNLDRHNWAVHKSSNTLVGNAAIKQDQKEI